MDLLIATESIWEFELNGTKRSKKYDKFYAVREPVLTYKHHVVERGKWFPWSARKFNKMGIGVDLESREIMNSFETLKWLFNKLFTPFGLLLPKKFRKIIKPLLSKLKILSYQ